MDDSRSAQARDRQPAGRRDAEQRTDDARRSAPSPRDEEAELHADVDEASEASFPASDPPAWGGMPPGGPRRQERGPRPESR